MKTNSLLMLSVSFLIITQSFSAIAKDSMLDLFAVLKEPAAWTLSQDELFSKVADGGFRYLDEKRTSASSVGGGRISFLDMPVYDARLFWKEKDGEKLLSRVELSIYNKGDSEDRLSQRQFNRLVRDSAIRLNQNYGKGRLGGVSKPRANYVQRQMLWTGRSPGIQLQWGYVEPHRSSGKQVPYSAEFVKVLLVPLAGSSAVDRAALTGTGMMVKAKNMAQLRKGVRREKDGTVWIDGIPMVDQGQKGYCAVATAERLLRFYGLQVDQHEIAQIAETKAGGGTSLVNMALAISKIGHHYRLDKKDLLPIEDQKNFLKSDFMKQLEDYNSAAKKKHADQLDWEDYTTDHVVDIQKIWADMDPEILKAARMKQRQAFRGFMRDIKRYVDMGVPIIWSCMAGMYPETPPLGREGAFGHIRLIIGYNAQTQEIFYSDSWGADHAKKKMEASQAWAMTKGMMMLKPRM